MERELGSLDVDDTDFRFDTHLLDANTDFDLNENSVIH